MKVTNFLSSIFQEKKISVLKFFHQYPKGKFTGMKISQELGLNHKTCLVLLNQLTDIGILNKEIMGKAHIFYIQPSFYWDEIINLIIEKEKNIISMLSVGLIDRFSDEVEKIILFGSYATNNEREGSDIDVCFVVRSKSKGLEEKIDHYEDEFYTRYLCHLSPYVVTEMDYKKEKMAIIKEIKREGKELWSRQKK